MKNYQFLRDFWTLKKEDRCHCGFWRTQYSFLQILGHFAEKICSCIFMNFSTYLHSMITLFTKHPVVILPRSNFPFKICLSKITKTIFFWNFHWNFHCMKNSGHEYMTHPISPAFGRYHIILKKNTPKAAVCGIAYRVKFPLKWELGWIPS